MTPQINKFDADAIEQHLTVNMNLSKKQIMLNNFLGGLAWGIGTVIGATFIAGSVVYTLNRMGVFNAVGSLFGN